MITTYLNWLTLISVVFVEDLLLMSFSTYFRHLLNTLCPSKIRVHDLMLSLYTCRSISRAFVEVFVNLTKISGIPVYPFPFWKKKGVKKSWWKNSWWKRRLKLYSPKICCMMLQFSNDTFTFVSGGPVDWGCRIHRTPLCSGVKLSPRMSW